MTPKLRILLYLVITLLLVFGSMFLLKKYVQPSQPTIIRTDTVWQDKQIFITDTLTRIKQRTIYKPDTITIEDNSRIDSLIGLSDSIAKELRLAHVKGIIPYDTIIPITHDTLNIRYSEYNKSFDTIRFSYAKRTIPKDVIVVPKTDKSDESFWFVASGAAFVVGLILGLITN